VESEAACDRWTNVQMWYSRVAIPHTLHYSKVHINIAPLCHCLSTGWQNRTFVDI